MESLTGATKKAKDETKTWLDFIKNVGIKTIKEEETRIRELEGFLGDLDKAYKDGKISLEAYTESTKIANEELAKISTTIDTQTLPAFRDMTGVVEQVSDDMTTKIGDFTDAVVEKVDIMATRWGDIINGMSGAFGQFVFDVLSTGSTFTEDLKGLWEGMKNVFKNVISDMVEDWVKNFLKKLVTKTATSVVEVGKSIINVGKSVADVGKSISGLLPAAATLIAAFVPKKTTGWQKEMQKIARDTFDMLMDTLKHTQKEITPKLERILEEVVPIDGILRDILSQARIRAHQLSSIASKNDNMINNLKAMVKGIDSMAKSLNEIVKPGLASGGIVTKPTIKLIGENAPRIPEVVAPLPDFNNMLRAAARSGTGGGNKFEINVNNKIDISGQIITDTEFTRRRLMPEIMESLKTNVGITQLIGILKAKGAI